MAIRASPITGLSLVPRPSSSSSSLSCSNRVVMLRRTLFLNGGVGYLRLSVPTTHPNRCIHTGALGTRMHLFNRFARVVKIQSLAPLKILRRSLNKLFEMNDDLIKMCQASAQVLASQKRLETKEKAAQQASEDWYRRAQLALEKGDENLAREALKRRKSYADNAAAWKSQLDQQMNVVDNLVSNTRLLESRIQDARSKKDTLKARAQSAKTATKMSEMLGNLNTSSALSAFEKMEGKVMMMESQADALNQLTTDDLEGKFAYLESSLDDDLANLKREISRTAVRKELPPGRSAVSSTLIPSEEDTKIEIDVNELKEKPSED